VIGDPNGGLGSIQPEPFMGFRVEEFVRYVHGSFGALGLVEVLAGGGEAGR
jgi:hypothetical protein